MKTKDVNSRGLTLAKSLFLSAAVLTGCARPDYRYQDPLPGLNRKEATAATIVQHLGEPARISHSSGKTKEGPPTDTAYRYYFATRDGHPGAKIFYFYKDRWTGENTLRSERRGELFRLLDPSNGSDRKLIAEWETENPYVW